MSRKRVDKTDICNEYQIFSETDGVAPPKAMSDEVLSYVRVRLAVPLWSVLLKLVGIYVVAGVGVLLICPQFGLTLFAKTGMVALFGFLGTYGCMAACGALFLGSGALVASVLLQAEELARVRSFHYVYFVVIGLVALAAFLAFGAKIAFAMGLTWWLGSIAGEILGFELGRRLRYASVSTPPTTG